jgi:hypothetical protein
MSNECGARVGASDTPGAPWPVRTVSLRPGQLDVTRRPIVLATELRAGCVLGLADPVAAVGGAVHLTLAWQPGHLCVHDVATAVDRLLRQLRSHGGAYARLRAVALATDADVRAHVAAALGARGLPGDLRVWPRAPALVRFAPTLGRIRVRDRVADDAEQEHA